MDSGVILPYPSRMILLVEVGSTAHGTGLEGGEDHDETAVVVETPLEIFAGSGLKNRMERTQPEGSRSGPGDVDRQIYSLRKFVDLCLKGNPSIQLVLYAPVLVETPLGLELRSLAPSFIGRHVVERYRGYMQGQIQRMQGLKKSGHGKRGGGKREELIEAHGYDTKYAMHAARLGYQCIELMKTGKLELPIAGESGDWLRSVRRGEVEYGEWFDRVRNLDILLEQWENNTAIRPGPELGRVKNWLVEAHKTDWSW